MWPATPVGRPTYDWNSSSGRNSSASRAKKSPRGPDDVVAGVSSCASAAPEGTRRAARAALRMSRVMRVVIGRHGSQNLERLRRGESELEGVRIRHESIVSGTNLPYVRVRRIAPPTPLARGDRIFHVQ